MDPVSSNPRRFARGAALSLLMLSACQAMPAAIPPGDPPASHAPEAIGATPLPRRSPPDDAPLRVRPPWDGTRKEPVIAKPLAFPTTWKGDLTVRDLAMVGSTLYTLDRTLQAVPLSGGAWAPVAVGEGRGLTRLASDGQHLFAGTEGGQVLGLDPGNGKSATLATLPSAVTGLQVGQNVLWAGTDRDGIFRIPLTGGAAHALLSGDPGDRKVKDLALGDGVIFTLGDRVHAWPMDGAASSVVPGTEGATSMTAHRGVLYVGTADGWLLRSKDQGASCQGLGQMADTPLEALGTDGAWLYSSSGNTTYMLDLKHYTYSLCHQGFAASVTNLTVMDGATVLVGMRAKGLTSMPR